MHYWDCKLTVEIQESIRKEFIDDLPMPHSYDQEVVRWKQAFTTHNLSDADLIDMVNLADTTFYPNISTVLRILVSIVQVL